MTQKIRMLAMLLLAMALAVVGFGGAVDAHAATTPASLAWSPTTSSGTYDYGTLNAGAGQTKSVTFTLTNAGGMASGTLAITLSGPSAFTITKDGCTGTSLGPKKSCTVTAKYAPTSSGENASASLSATGENASASLTLTGKSLTPTPNLTLSPGTFIGTDSNGNNYLYNFGQVASATQTFTVTNIGTGSSETLTLAGSNQFFTLSNDTCTNTSLAPNGTCTFDLSVTTAGCPSGSRVGITKNVNGVDVKYILLIVDATCA
jgi:hypothetical protein